MSGPLVSVICICCNHRPYVEEAVESAIHQSYRNTEVIVVDDGSTDGSRDAIRTLCGRYPHIKTILRTSNHGYCRSFNEGLRLSAGEFIIDLAADDILLPDRVSRGVEAFRSAGEELGVNHCDTERIAPGGDPLYLHSELHPHDTIPQGDIYLHLIKRYFIASPTMMIRRKVLEEMGGYDEALEYEDFDLWIRSSRRWRYSYTPEVLVKKRVLPHSLSSRQRKLDARHASSTLAVCEKIYRLNRLPLEFRALCSRAGYEARQCIKGLHFQLTFAFMRLAFMAWRKSV